MFRSDSRLPFKKDPTRKGEDATIIHRPPVKIKIITNKFKKEVCGTIPKSFDFRG